MILSETKTQLFHVLTCEIANWAKDNGKSLNDILEEIYDTYGFFKEKLYTIKMEGISEVIE